MGVYVDYTDAATVKVARQPVDQISPTDLLTGNATRSLPGFSVLRLDQLTMGWDVTTTGQMDGFHYNFNAMSMGAMIVINTICNIPLKDYAEGRFYDVGEKLKVDSDSSDLLFTYKKTTVTIDGGREADVLVPASDRYEKSKEGESWKIVNPCNCFDTERIVPYNLVEDPVSFDVFGD